MAMMMLREYIYSILALLDKIRYMCVQHESFFYVYMRVYLIFLSRYIYNSIVSLKSTRTFLEIKKSTLYIYVDVEEEEKKGRREKRENEKKTFENEMNGFHHHHHHRVSFIHTYTPFYILSFLHIVRLNISIL